MNLNNFEDDRSEFWSREILEEILTNSIEQGKTNEELIRNQIQVKDSLIEKLHKELENYKNDYADRFIEQVMKEIISLRRKMCRHIISLNPEEITKEELLKEYTYLYEDITDLLEQQHIDSYISQPGEDFNPAIHKAKIEMTANASLNKKIKETINEGYIKNGKVLIPEVVIIYQFKEQ